MNKHNEKTKEDCSFEQELSVGEFLDRLDGYLNGKSQDMPEIIWFDNKPYEHLNFARTPDYLGLAETLSEHQLIAMNSSVGSSMGPHLVRDNEDGSIKLVPSESIHYDNGTLREKILILRCMTPERGESAVKLGKLIKDVLRINVIIFMPYFQKEDITASFNDYYQFRLKDR